MTLNWSERMNFTDFIHNVEVMGIELQEKGIKPDEVKIEYTKFDGNNCIWAMNGDNIVSYFKW